MLHKIVWVAVESCRNDDISIVLCGQFKYSIGILGSALATIIPSDTNQASASGIRNLETMAASGIISKAVSSITADGVRFQQEIYISRSEYIYIFFLRFPRLTIFIIKSLRPILSHMFLELSSSPQ